MRTPLLFTTALLGALASLPAQTWTQQSPTNVPTTRRAGGLVFDPIQNGVLMYGGLQSPTLTLNETWLFAGGNWTQLSPATTPPPRWGHRMVFDSRRNRIVTFGGRSPTTTANANDTWEWDGSNWQQMSPAVSPNARAFYSMAFDERRGRVVLFGMQSGAGTGANATWEYDGTTWSQAITGTVPPGLETPALVYDKGRGVVVMFGGWNGVSPGQMFNTTWEYDGVDWTLRSPATSPPARYRSAHWYDDARGRVVVYGGHGTSALTDTWEYDGNTWTQVATGGPVRSTEGYAAFDRATGSAVYFGGSGPTGVSNETWTFSAPTNAIAAPYGRGCATSAGVPTLQPASLPQLGSNYTLTLTGAPAVSIAVVVHGLDNLQFAPGIWLPFDLTPAGIAGCLLEVRPDALLTEIAVGGAFTHLLTLPATPALTGTGLFSQALVVDGAAPNGFGGMSNAVHGVLGS
jgi:hypothetical protein